MKLNTLLKRLFLIIISHESFMSYNLTILSYNNILLTRIKLLVKRLHALNDSHYEFVKLVFTSNVDS